MLDLVEDHHRDRDDLELRFMRAIRVAVPASLDDKADRFYTTREQKLLDSVNDSPGGGS